MRMNFFSSLQHQQYLSGISQSICFLLNIQNSSVLCKSLSLSLYLLNVFSSHSRLSRRAVMPVKVTMGYETSTKTLPVTMTSNKVSFWRKLWSISTSSFPTITLSDSMNGSSILKHTPYLWSIGNKKIGSRILVMFTMNSGSTGWSMEVFLVRLIRTPIQTRML